MSDPVPARRPLVLAVLLVTAALVSVGLLVGGASGPNGAQTDRAQPNATAADDRLQSLDGFAATREVVVDRGNETTRTVDEVTRRLGGGLRVERVSGPGRVDVIVANESARWHYDRDENVATRYDRSASPSGLRQEIPQLLARLNASGSAADETPTPGVSPLPVVPAAGPNASADGPVGGNGSYAVSYEGTATVDGRETFVVRVRQTTEGTEPVADYSQTIWLDAERYVPLKRQTTWTQAGERTEITTTYSNVTVDPGVAADAFRFEPPANATVERPDSPDEETYGSVAALRANASMSVPVPDLPPDYGLERASTTEGRRVTSVGLRYVNATATVEVAKLEPVYQPRTDGERVTVAGRTATYRNLGPEQSVVWTCNGTQYKVSTTGLGRAGTLAIATSVGCG